MSTTATRKAPARAPSAHPEARSTARRALLAAAGPCLIVVAVLVALRGFVLGGHLTDQHPDILSFVLPRLAFLGRSLRAGHVPLWNPFEMTGTPYIADPQSGWLYALPSVAFTLLSPGAAMNAFIVANPVIAGLGLYAFLRMERLSRTAATVAGLSIAMAMAASAIAISMPFAGAMAWTSVTLVGASGYSRTTRWSRRCLWLGVGAFAWGQVASAHMSHGLGMCTLVVVTYLAANVIRAAKEGRRAGRRAALLGLLFLVALPLANLAIFLPRLAFLSRSSLQGGYGNLPGSVQAGANRAPIAANGVWSGWPFALGAAPGAYVGSIVLVCVPAALRTKRFRALAATFAGVGLVVYVLTLNVLVEAEWFRTTVLEFPFGAVYLHNPGRLRYLMYFVVAVLGAVGVQSFLDRPLPWRRALRWLAAGVVLWLVLPLVFGAHPLNFLPLLGTLLVAVPLVLALSERRAWALWAIPVFLAFELTGGAVASSLTDGGPRFTGLESGEHANVAPEPLAWPDVRASAFLEPGAFARFLGSRQDRYLTWAPPAAYFVKGYLWTQDQGDWPALENERGTLFGAHDVLGYNPVQLPGYWSYVRATNRLFVFYNASVINQPTIEDLRLLGARYLIVPEGVSPPVPGTVIRQSSGYDLVDVAGAEPRASVVGDWTVVPDPDRALAQTVAPGFDPAETAILNRSPALTPTPGAVAGTASYSEATPEDVTVHVDAPSDSLVVVRNNWDVGWHATVDGRPAPVLVADAFRQGVPVRAGEHTVRLTYTDPRVGRGVAASTIAWAAILLGGLVALVLERRRRPAGDADAPDDIAMVAD
jgi:hypothetical protein